MIEAILVLFSGSKKYNKASKKTAINKVDQANLLAKQDEVKAKLPAEAEKFVRGMETLQQNVVPSRLDGR